MQLNSLKSYFLSHFDLDDDLIENNPKEKISREKRLVNAFKQPIIFDQSVIPIFDRFDTFLQAEELLIHILYHSFLRLYRLLLSRFILLEVISEAGDVLNIDLEDPDIWKDFKSIFIGAMTKKYARDYNVTIIGIS